MDLDNVLKELGQFGWYQIKIFAVLVFPLAFCAIGSMTYVFTAGDIQYRCVIPECEENNLSKYDTPWKDWAVPHKSGDAIDPCLRYRAAPGVHQTNCSRDAFYTNVTEYCHEYIYESNEKTIINEFGIQCKENNWKRTIIGTLNNVGQFIGLPISGVLSDKFGRRTMVLICGLISACFGILRSFTTSYIQFIVFEVLDAIAYTGMYSGIFVYGIEMIGPDKRGVGGAILSSYYSIGEVILGIAVWYIQDWRQYLRVLYVPGFLLLSYFWLIPESTRWLLSHGKNERVVKILTDMSNQNRRPMSEDVKKQIQDITTAERSLSDTITKQEEKVQYPLKEVFFSRILLLRVLNCAFCWMTHTFVFYGLSLNSVGIAGNKYLNFILVSLIEIPGYFLSWGMVGYCGRRLSLCMGLVISGAACTAFHFADADAYTLRLILFLAGKLAITESFTTLYVLASEMYPTDLRHSLMSFCSTLGRFGSMVAPMTPLLAGYMDPVLLFGAISFVAAAVGLCFPETLNCKLPDTIEEAELLGNSKLSLTSNSGDEKRNP